jgi:hypothetical protein
MLSRKVPPLQSTSITAIDATRVKTVLNKQKHHIQALAAPRRTGNQAQILRGILNDKPEMPPTIPIRSKVRCLFALVRISDWHNRRLHEDRSFVSASILLPGKEIVKSLQKISPPVRSVRSNLRKARRTSGNCHTGSDVRPESTGVPTKVTGFRVCEHCGVAPYERPADCRAVGR